MVDITIFSIPKLFDKNTKIIQTNAIQSWAVLKPKPQIILFGNEKGTKEITKKYNLKYIPDVSRNKYNTPELNSLFSKVQKVSVSNIFMYINTDIILTQNLVKTIENINKKFKNFLVIGRRYEASIKKYIDYSNNNWEFDYLRNNKLKSSSWVDYFIFTKGLFKNIPPFAIGRTFWDKWLIWYARSKKYPIIDATDTITAIHQTHQYFQGAKNIWEGEEAVNNLKMAGGWSHGFTINQADYKLNKYYYPIKLKKNSFFYYLNRTKRLLDKLTFLYPFFLKIRYIRNRIQSNLPKEVI